MITKGEFHEKLKEIAGYAKRIKSYLDNPDLLIEEIKKINSTTSGFIKEERDQYEISSLTSEGTELAPVNFIRFVTLNRLYNNQPLTAKNIDEIKNALIKKDLTYFEEYPNHHEAIKKLVVYPRTFQSWKSPFRVLFQIYYHHFYDPIQRLLEDVIKYIQHDLGLADRTQIKISNFNDNNYFGRSFCWLALYPSVAASHQNAYQIFIYMGHDKKIYPEYSFVYGIGLGSNIDDKTFKENQGLIKTDIENLDLDEFRKNMLAFIPKFTEKNANPKLKVTKKTKKAKSEEPIQVDVVEKEDENEEETELDAEEDLGEEDVALSTAPAENIILYGPPGTGKTYLSIEKAVKLVDDKFKDEKERKKLSNRFKELKDSQILLLTFHQSYSYEEFIEGFRYSEDQKKPIVTPGLFKKFVDDSIEKTKNNLRMKFVVIIDEINRGNISKIFGELLTNIEIDKRLGTDDEMKIVLPYSKKEWGIPPNISFIGTMNSADRSIALMDIALRRRFNFIEINPNPDLIKAALEKNERFKNPDVYLIRLVDVFKKLNKRIEILIDKDHCIGHSYFMKLKSKGELYDLWYQQIIPLLQEYCYNDWDKMVKLIGLQKDKPIRGFVKEITQDHIKSVFENADETWKSYEIQIYEKNDIQFMEILKNTFTLQ